MTRANVISAPTILGLLGRGVFIELLRKKDVYVLGLLILVFCIGALSANLAGIENPATGTFLLNLGMTLAYIFTHLLTLLLASRQIPTEIENRTIYPILARPIARVHLLAGKWLACTLCGFTAYLLFFALIWAVTPKLEAYDAALLSQHLLLQFFSMGLTASLAIMLSLMLPKALVALLTGTLLFAGHMIKGIILSMFSGGAGLGIARWLLLYLPDFSKLQLTTRYTDGMAALTAPVFIGLLLHGLFFMVGCLYLSHLLFRRRPL